MPENYFAYCIYIQYRNVIYNSDGINLLAIDKALEYEHVPEELRAIMAKKLITYTTVIINKSLEKDSGNNKP